MPLSNFSELKASIANWLDDPNLTSYIPDFITLVENRIDRSLRVREMQSRATASLSTTSRFLAFPAGYIEMLRFRLNTSPISLVTYTNREGIDGRHNETAGKPKWFTDVDGQLEFDRISDSAYTAEMVYYKKITPLSDAAPTNDILTNYPMVYLFGALSEGADFVSDDRLVLWEGKYQAALDKANDVARRQRTKGTGILTTETPLIGSTSYNVNIE